MGANARNLRAYICTAQLLTTAAWCQKRKSASRRGVQQSRWVYAQSGSCSPPRVRVLRLGRCVVAARYQGAVRAHPRADLGGRAPKLGKPSCWVLMTRCGSECAEPPRSVVYTDGSRGKVHRAHLRGAAPHSWASPRCSPASPGPTPARARAVPNNRNCRINTHGSPRVGLSCAVGVRPIARDSAALCRCVKAARYPGALRARPARTPGALPPRWGDRHVGFNDGLGVGAATGHGPGP